MTGYIERIAAMTIPELPKDQRTKADSIDEAYEMGWRECQENIAHIPASDVISREAAINAVRGIYSPYGDSGDGDAISREVVLSKLSNLQ